MTQRRYVQADVRCRAFFDGESNAYGTHTCVKTAGHDGLHVCPTCGLPWNRPRVQGGEVGKHVRV